MQHQDLVFYIFIIFTGSAVLATLALYARQALIIGYILMGVLMGPPLLNVVSDTEVLTGIADIGIIFLLFLLGLNLQPQDLVKLLRKTTELTLLTSLFFAATGFVIAWFFNFSLLESSIIGAAMMFSSTIIGLKLLPTTVLHHRHAGEIMVSVLLLQDIIAILLLLILKGTARGGSLWLDIAIMALSLPLLIGFAWVFERYVLDKLFQKFDKIQEYMFLLTIGWCLGMAELAALLKISHEIGAFIGGVALASSPIARFIAESLKPLRDFFLVLFFFTLGARLDLDVLYTVLIPSCVLALVMLLLKPIIFYFLLVRLGEKKNLSLEMGVRLGQISEFSLLIAVIALEVNVISKEASFLIQTASLLTFIFSSYYIVMRYPTPIAVSDRLRRD